MRWARGIVIVETGIVIGVTVFDAAMGDSLGRVLVGAALSIAGIFLVAMTRPPVGE